ncbi:hypothetical protein D7U98_03740 [Stenotrophomonas maltophilia]|uniref:Uncharacterized protein n=1 Tax=Stenotrophomonas maltophilia (strain R551-3) TaxID=391008 RepID=B4SPI5_STRM5|nr:hypothetical protein [Stenotrophomonas maltophilia]ACF50872.1 hypothetical protein Smal_1167 [Stenotrophomonas maltophilia R551-3]MBA0394518.1 hypothetical protein [Stenotrophomonas maltophilia]MBH1495979.1 hypothetical protein [Stenotrophomonas maltophilia]MBN4962953.1 hypothetical protein [Stenotrophomonas maltophilia]MBN5141255.1 hypothetical protein [Stenotrophomonas maltophilia]
MTQHSAPHEGPQAKAAVEAPPSLYIVALYQIVGGALALYGMLEVYGPKVPEYQLLARMSLYHSLPYAALVTAGVLNGLAGIVIGVGIFARWGWVRPLFVIMFLETMVLKLVDMKSAGPFEFLTLGAIFCVSLYCAFLLYREPASRYFASRAR